MDPFGCAGSFTHAGRKRPKETTRRHHRRLPKEGQIDCRDARVDKDNGGLWVAAGADLNPTLRYKRVKFPAKRPKVMSETQRQRMGTIMRSFITKGRLIAATVTLILLVAGFLAGAQHGYNLGYLDGENRANGWWIDKKTHYYESSEIRKKRINLKHNHI